MQSPPKCSTVLDLRGTLRHTLYYFHEAPANTAPALGCHAMVRQTLSCRAGLYPSTVHTSCWQPRRRSVGSGIIGVSSARALKPLPRETKTPTQPLQITLMPTPTWSWIVAPKIWTKNRLSCRGRAEASTGLVTWKLRNLKYNHYNLMSISLSCTLYCLIRSVRSRISQISCVTN